MSHRLLRVRTLLIRNPRGQTLPIVALGLLLLVLMVMMTLGIAARIHEKEELQTTADAAAYSEAVVQARTFNSVAVFNRVLVAQMASIAAGQATLSWLGFYHGALNQARDVLAENGGCAGAGAAKALIEAEDLRLIKLFEPSGCYYPDAMGLDSKAAAYIREDLYATAQLITRDQHSLYEQLSQKLNGTGPLDSVSEGIARQARLASPWGPALDELKVEAVKRQLTLAIDDRQQHPEDMVRATLATRGVDPFISARAANAKTGTKSAGDFVDDRLNKVMAGSGFTAVVYDYGTAYFGEKGPERASGPGELDGLDNIPLKKREWVDWRPQVHDSAHFRVWGAWAWDRGTFTLRSASCSLTQRPEDSFGYLVTTNTNHPITNHMWQRGATFDYRETNDEDGHVCKPIHESQARHGFQPIPYVADRTQIWPVFVDLSAKAIRNADPDKNNVEGQPTSIVVLSRDYSKRDPDKRDPWELKFTFRFDAAGTGEKIDLRASHGLPAFRKAFAASTGIVYYHRGSSTGAPVDDNFREPPNMLNPFWRATLSTSDAVEMRATRGDQAISALNAAGANTAANTLDDLRTAGFEAIP